jgi:hypothetical protein
MEGHLENEKTREDVCILLNEFLNYNLETKASDFLTPEAVDILEDQKMKNLKNKNVLGVYGRYSTPTVSQKKPRN